MRPCDWVRRMGCRFWADGNLLKQHRPIRQTHQPRTEPLAQFIPRQKLSFFSVVCGDVVPPPSPTGTAGDATAAYAIVHLEQDMVNTGRPSQGCATCKTRKIKVRILFAIHATTHPPWMGEWGLIYFVKVRPITSGLLAVPQVPMDLPRSPITSRRRVPAPAAVRG